MRLSEPHGPSSPMEGLYFARSPNPSKRWRSFFNPKIVGRQPSYYSFTTPEEFYCPETVRRMLTELRRWVHDLPPPTALMNGTDDSRLSLTRKKSLDTEDRWQDDDTVDHLQRWWSMAYPLGESTSRCVYVRARSASRKMSATIL